MKHNNHINSPRHAHLKLLWGWVVYFLFYYLTERWIAEDACHVIHCALDDKIPFWEGFAVFYVGWYGLILFSLGYFLLYSIESFRKLQIYIMVVQLLATVIFILYPSRQELRPESFPRENFLSLLMGLIYRIDTPTGVFPSLHVAISIAMGSVWLRDRIAPRWLRLGVVWFCVMVCLSVCFVKQHSVLDVLGAIPVCLVGEWTANYFVKKASP